MTGTNLRNAKFVFPRIYIPLLVCFNAWAGTKKNGQSIVFDEGHIGLVKPCPGCPYELLGKATTSIIRGASTGDLGGSYSPKKFSFFVLIFKYLAMVRCKKTNKPRNQSRMRH